MNHKRKKSKRSVRCTICTPHRWKGNSKERFNHNTNRRKLDSKDDLS